MYQPRFQIEIKTKNEEKIVQLVEILNNNIFKSDLIYLPYETNSTLTGIYNINQNTYNLKSNYLFFSLDKVNTIYNIIKSEISNQINGKISLHLCPTGEINNWQGCKDDPRAQYKEFIF